MFTVGNVVACINSARTSLIEGMFFRVIAVNPDNNTIRLEHLPRWFSSSRFVFAGEDAKPNVVNHEFTVLNGLRKRVGNKAGMCSYAIRFERHIRYQVRDVCHARLAYGYGNEAERNPAVVALNIRGHLDSVSAGYREYVDYIINHSPWASVFIKNLPLEQILDNGICLDVNRHINEVVSAAIALRIGSEYHWSTPLFAELLKAGINPHVCWILSQHIRPAVGVPYKYKYAYIHGGHHVISSYMNANRVIEFLKTGKFLNLDDSSYRTFGEKYAVLTSIGTDEKQEFMQIGSVIRTLPGFKWEQGTWSASYTLGSFDDVLLAAKELETKF